MSDEYVSSYRTHCITAREKKVGVRIGGLRGGKEDGRRVRYGERREEGRWERVEGDGKSPYSP